MKKGSINSFASKVFPSNKVGEQLPLQIMGEVERTRDNYG